MWVGPESPALRTREKGQLGQQRTGWLTSGPLSPSLHLFSPGSAAPLSVFLLEGWVPVLKHTMCNNPTSSGAGSCPPGSARMRPGCWRRLCPPPAPIQGPRHSVSGLHEI